MIIIFIHRFRTVELSSVEQETLTVPIQPDISQFVKDIDFQVNFCLPLDIKLQPLIAFVHSFQYVDFAKRGRDSEFPTFRINVRMIFDMVAQTIFVMNSNFLIQSKKTNLDQDFNWDEQGYSMISRFYDDVAQLLDDKVGNHNHHHHHSFSCLGGGSILDVLIRIFLHSKID